MAFSAWTPELEQWLHLEAVASGFDIAGLAAVGSPPSSAEQLTADRFAGWIEAGHAGEMEYLKRRDAEGVLLRSEVVAAIPWARSIIVCAFNYNADAPLSTDLAPCDTGWIARYAWSGGEVVGKSGDEGVSEGAALQPTDYHTELLGRLRRLESAVQERLGCQTRCYVDTGPIVERAAAANAGVGWIGKNTCVLNEQLGSWLLLGVMVTSLPVASTVSLEAAVDRCGSCTRCIDACPTEALIAPRQMDASRCIAYLTIEKKGAIAEDLLPLMGRQVFGCDICQDVCPWNRRAPIAAAPEMRARAELINPALEWLAALDAKAFKRYFKGSPLERTGRGRLLRNVAIAMGNSGREQFIPILQGWSRPDGQGEPGDRGGQGDRGDPILAEAAQWAIRQIEEKRGQTI